MDQKQEMKVGLSEKWGGSIWQSEGPVKNNGLSEKWSRKFLRNNSEYEVKL